jgi:hypothetical protein
MWCTALRLLLLLLLLQWDTNLQQGGCIMTSAECRGVVRNIIDRKKCSVSSITSEWLQLWDTLAT